MKNPAQLPLRHLYRWLKKGLARRGYYSKPSFLIIGAQRTGTSALFSMLGQHPRIGVPDGKELAFFNDTAWAAGIPYGDFPAYHSMFPLPFRRAPGALTFEATPEYLVFPECPKRIHDYAPDMKLIAILRDPVARAYSAWNMFRSFVDSPDATRRSLAENRTFEEAVTAEIRLIEQGRSTRPWNYVSTGMYAAHLQRFFQHFARDAMLILDHAELLRTPETCLAATCRFLGIDEAFRFKIARRNVSRYESPIPEGAAVILRAFFQPQNARLFALLDREFEWGRMQGGR